MLSGKLAKLIELRESNNRSSAHLKALDRAINSQVFRNSPKKAKLLRFLVEEAILGRSHKELSLGIEIFRADYDPERDSDVRVAAREVRVLLKAWYKGEGRNEAIRISLPPGGYSIVFETVRSESNAAD